MSFFRYSPRHSLSPTELMWTITGPRPSSLSARGKIWMIITSPIGLFSPFFFQPQLKKFPEPPLLRIFMPEKRTFVPKHNRLGESVQAVFYVSSHHRRRSFGTQNKAVVPVA